jgi:hypothetical protein
MPLAMAGARAAAVENQSAGVMGMWVWRAETRMAPLSG